MGKATKPKPSAQVKQKARRARVAVALSEGATVKAIAKSEKVSPKTVITDAQSADVRVLIDRMVDKYATRMEQTFVRCLDVIDSGLEASRIVTISVGKGVQETVNLGPDHYARLTAAKSFKELCLANRPTPKADDKRKPGVWALDDLRELQRMLGGANDVNA